MQTMSLDSSKPASKRRRTTTAADITPGKDPVPDDDLELPAVVSNLSYSSPSKDHIKQWTDYDLSPSKLVKPIEQAIKLADTDGFYESELKDKYAFVLYLYGTGFYEKDPDRREKIQKYIEDDKILSRLKHIALSPMADTVPQDRKKAFKSYCKFVTVSEFIFGKDKICTTGFPVEPYLRLQQSRNCYIAAPTLFVSLNMQKQNPNQKPLDVGWVAHHHAIDTKDRLEQRVIKNSGGNSQVMAENIISTKLWKKRVKKYDLGDQDEDKTMLALYKDRIEKYLKEGFYGLVSCWRVSPKWRGLGTQNTRNELGVWKFAGNTSDCEGSFVPCNSNLNQAKIDELHKLWQSGIQSVQNNDEANNIGVNFTTDITHEEDEGDQGAATEEHNDNARASLHAMVLLGSTKIDGEKLFVLLNTWKKMPLILVSFEYMVACKCKISMVWKDLPPNILNKKGKCGLLAAECSHLDYVEEGCYIEGERDYEILEGSL